ncbi:nuclear transport factor 2 family protein [Actinomycetospora sp.]|uniref:nuclear transport factor 2 family protein n=1 Tax=Actinomycetospora sp. TaxID=1872135 RepID=UPI002F42F675
MTMTEMTTTEMTTTEANTSEANTSEAATPETTTATTLAALARFNTAFDAQDIDAIMEAMTPDCVFEDTSPPNGTCHTGAGAVRAAWTTLFTASPDGVFTTEETIIADDRAVVRWRYDWGNGHVRGIDVFTIRGGLVAEKLAYVKG